VKHWLLFTGYFLLTFCCFGQKEANIWYFGNGAGLDFRSGSPVTFDETRLSTMEGCAVISNEAGNLLFYTDGITIWNAQHQVMENGTGLLGDKSSTQSAVIVPQPGSKSIYYIFTVDNVPGTDGVRYSVVDMSQENNAGKLITKNILLQAPVTEKLTAVKHHNNKDIWVLAHGYNSNIFYAYLVTEAGVANESVPIISASGTIHYGNVTNNAIGYMKASPDGKNWLWASGAYDFMNFLISTTIQEKFPIRSLSSRLTTIRRMGLNFHRMALNYTSMQARIQQLKSTR
jgi:hypothetical protein